jgi:hypothetical protein
MLGCEPKLSSYALVGIDAVHVDVIVEGDPVKVVATRSRSAVHSVRLESTESASSVNAAPPDGASEFARGLAVNRSDRGSDL